MEVNQSIGFVSLPTTFQLTFGYKVQANLLVPGNVLDIYSLSLNTSLLSIYLQPKSNILAVYYLGARVNQISFVQSIIDFASISISIDFLSITISNGIDPDIRTIISNAVKSERNVVFASNIVVSNQYTSAGGLLSNMQILGCCFYHRTLALAFLKGFHHLVFRSSLLYGLYLRTN